MKQVWNIINFKVEGTPDSPKEINYGDLTDVNGYTLPSSISKPSVGVSRFKQDRGAFITEVGTESFKISKSGSGVSGDVYVDLKICENVDPWLER